jgi:hypothetical protein
MTTIVSLYFLPHLHTKNYFDHLFRANASSHDSVLNLISPKIAQEDNDYLVVEITMEEVKNTLFQMYPDKASGPDIFDAIKKWLQRDYFHSSLNGTNICLIPKCENSMSISICNVLYKVVSKLIVNRLKIYLAKCMAEEQSTFVKGRSILDNALIGAEIIHAFKHKTKGRKCDLVLKIDISKAYDKVDWASCGVCLRGWDLLKSEYTE